MSKTYMLPEDSDFNDPNVYLFLDYFEDQKINNWKILNIGLW